MSNPSLAYLIRKEFPELSLTASVLMDIHSPGQLTMIDGLFDKIVPSGKILRNAEALKKLRSSWEGKIRLIVNEACIPGCIYRTQHFYEMGLPGICYPESLCTEMLSGKPWLRLTGAWILPQFLDLYEGLYDELKLSGRVTLKDKEKYQSVISGYIERRIMMPYEIGGGPASPLEPIMISRDFFERTLHCDHNCAACDYCRDYWHSNNSGDPRSIARSVGNSISEQTQKLRHYIDQFRKGGGSEINMEQIMDNWDEIAAYYKTSERKMPITEWKEQSFADSGPVCWQKLTEIISNHCSKQI